MVFESQYSGNFFVLEIIFMTLLMTLIWTIQYQIKQKAKWPIYPKPESLEFNTLPSALKQVDSLIYPLIYGQLIITRLLIWTKTHINLHIEANTNPTNYALQIDFQNEGCQILQTTHPNQLCSNSKGMVQKKFKLQYSSSKN